MSTNLNDVKKFVVVNAGVIDREASIAQFASALTSYEQATAMDSDEVGMAVDSVFNKYRGQNISDVAGFVVRELAPTPENQKFVAAAVKEYLKAHTGEYGEASLGMRKGIGGGHWRWSDKADDSKEVKASLVAVKERDEKAAKAV